MTDMDDFLKIAAHHGPLISRQEIAFSLIVRAYRQQRSWWVWWALGYTQPPYRPEEHSLKNPRPLRPGV